MRTKLLAILMCTVSTAAFAEGDASENVDWTGWFIGAHAAHLTGKTNNAQGLPNGKADNFLGGIHGGYRQQFGNWVWGGALTVPLIADEARFTVPGLGFPNEVQFRGSVRGSVQLGRAIGRVMPYISAGIGASWIRGRERIGATLSPWANATHLVTTVGAGVNIAITENLSAGFAYNHLTTSNERYNCGPTVCATIGNIGLDGDIFGATFEYKFTPN